MTALAVPDFAPMRATITAWPAHPEEWLESLEGARECVAGMVRALATAAGAEQQVVLVRNPEAEADARARLGDLAHLVPGVYGDIWLRDTGPVLIQDPAGQIQARCFSTNGWGGKYDFPDDHGLAGRIAEHFELSSQRCDWVLEGGAIDCDGLGTVLTTEECLLNPNRNGSVTREQVEAWLARDLGARQVVWLGRGLIGDHTDGHVDNLARFLAPGVVAYTEPRAGEANHAIHSAVRDVLSRARDADGNPFQLVAVPSPGSITGADAKPMAASYMNFVIGRGAVVVPTYGTHDDDALEALRPHFDLPVVGVRSNALLTGGGSFHCITKSIPEEINP